MPEGSGNSEVAKYGSGGSVTFGSSGARDTGLKGRRKLLRKNSLWLFGCLKLLGIYDDSRINCRSEIYDCLGVCG